MHSSSNPMWPRMQRVRQRFPATPTIDIQAAIPEALAGVTGSLRPGARVAVAVGSRGITGLERMVRATITTLTRAGVRPFILPAMGSHGGATPAGQTALLSEYGVTEERLGVPVRAAMEVSEVGATGDGLRVVCSVEALRADAVLLLARVKPHTDFGGPIGSGLLKMLVVGLGKHIGAANFHRAAARHGHERVLRDSARVLRRHVPLFGGLAIVENQRHETARVQFVRPDDFEAREESLCAAARALMPTLPFATVDLLIVDRMGKNVSGTGMDPAVIGRQIHGYSLNEGAGQPLPRVRRLFVRDLTPESHGNAIGLGLADLTTTRLVQAMDARTTTINALTSLALQGAKIPIHFDTDREAIAQALATLPFVESHTARVVRIHDTLSVETMQASEACLATAEAANRLELLSEPQQLQFGPEGNLLDWESFP